MPKNFVVATMKKFNSSNLGGIEIHNERKTSKHSNKEIDPLRSRFNFDLVKVQGESYVDCVNKHISLNRKGSRKVRKDAIVLAEWVVSASPEAFIGMESKQIREYFAESVKYFGEKFGSENVVYAKVHMDESTPHMHMGIVPITQDKRLCAKDVFDRNALRDVQSELPKRLKESGFDVERGEKDSKRKKLTVPEYKEMKNELASLEQSCEIQLEKKRELEAQQRVLEQQNKALQVEFDSKISHVTNTINSVLKEHDIIPAGDEPVYFYDGLQKPIFMGSVIDFINTDTKVLARILKPKKSIAKNMEFISNDDSTPVNNVKEFEQSASETFKDIREQLISNIDRWKKSLVRYLNGVADKVNIGQAKITAKVKEWINPSLTAYTEETFVDGDVLGESNRFLYVNPKPNELRNVLSPARSLLDVDRSLGKKDKSSRPRATFLKNSSVARANDLLIDFNTPERAREIAKYYTPKVTRASRTRASVRR